MFCFLVFEFPENKFHIFLLQPSYPNTTTLANKKPGLRYWDVKVVEKGGEAWFLEIELPRNILKKINVRGHVGDL